MNIISKKLQDGGSLPPLASFVSVVQPTTVPLPFDEDNNGANYGKSSNKDKSTEILPMELIEKLAENGLQSDVKDFVSRVMQLSQSIGSNPYDISGSSLQEMDNAYKVLASNYLPEIFQAKKNLEAAVKLASEQGGLNEAAINSDGKVWVMNKNNKIVSKHIESVKDGVDTILTNAQLANLRETVFKFNPELTNTVYNAIGIPKITEYIKTRIATAASSTNKVSGEVQKEKDSVIGAKELGDIVAGYNVGDGLYKITKEITNSSGQAAQAINYVLATMPENYKTLLKIKAKNSLGDPTNKGLRTLVGLLIGSTMSDNISITSELVVNPVTGKAMKGNTNTSKGIDDVKMTPAIAFATGMGSYGEHYIGTGGNRAFKMYGFSGIPAMSGDKPMGENSLSELGRTDLAPVLDFNNVSFGNQKINLAQGNKIIVNGNGIIGADLPIDLQAYRNGQGMIKPDLAMLKQVEKADAIAKAKGYFDQLEQAKNAHDNNRVANIVSAINKIYADNGLQAKYRKDGELSFTYKRFALVPAAADEVALNGSINSDYVQEVEDINVRKAIQEAIKNNDKTAPTNASRGFLGFFKGDKVYQGTLFIPVRSSVVTASLTGGSGNLLEMGQATTLDAMEQHRQNRAPFQESDNFIKQGNNGQ